MLKLSRLVALLLVVLMALAACQTAAPSEPAPAADEPAATAEPAEEAGGDEGDDAAEDADADAGGDVINIGFMGPLTGGAAFIGTEQIGFARVAVDIFNERTGLNVQLVEGDTEINADVGRIVAERLIADESIVAVIGPAGSQVCESTMPIFEAAGVAHVTTACTRTSLTQEGTATDTFFRPIPADNDQSKTDAAYLVNELGATSVYLVDDQSSYSVGLDDEMEIELETLGATVAGRASVSQDETDFSSVVTAIVASGADTVFFPNQIESQMGTLAVQLREQGFEGIYFLADGGFSLGWVTTAGEAAEGAYVSFFSPDPNDVPEAAEYNERFAAEYTEDFGAFGGAAALVTFVVLDAVERCADAGDVTRECVVTALDETDLESTPLGLPIAFGEGNQVEGARFFIFQVENGEFVLVQ
ncbi:MAG: branched-chain amino acid ABC transporter substrate-binding protein [Litorilinea sp.]